MVKLLPMIRSDSFRSPRPSAMEARGAPPKAIRAAKAEITMMMGRHTPTPVRASLPTVSTGCMWPMYTRSTRLYSMLTIWEVMVGTARENSSFPTLPLPRSEPFPAVPEIAPPPTVSDRQTARPGRYSGASAPPGPGPRPHLSAPDGSPGGLSCPADGGAAPAPPAGPR